MQAEHSPAAGNATRYAASPNYILREIAGEAVLVSVGQGVADFCGVVILNASAKVLWQALSRGATADELTAALLQTFQVSPSQARADVEEALAMLMKRGMVHHV